MKVKIALKRNFTDQPIDTIRGEIQDMMDISNGILIRGRHFQETYDNNGNAVERPLSEDIRQYLVPQTSIRYVQIIEPNSESDRLDKEANSNPILKSRVRNCIQKP